MKPKRPLTVDNLLKKEYDLFDFDGQWKEAFDCPEKNGVWFVWGGSGNGKTTFVLELIKYLATFDRVLLNSLEEGTAHTMKRGFQRVGMEKVANQVLLVSETYEELMARLSKRRAPRIVVVDSFQYFQLNYKQYISFKEKMTDKLLVFTSHADGKLPSGRSAKSVMYDATLKIWVEGYKAISKGRYIGNTGEYVIWQQGVDGYWVNKN